MATGTATPTKSHGLIRGLGLFDSTMLVSGSMIGSGIFIVSAEMGRQVGSPAWLLGSWLITGLLTLAAALSYGELAAMMPRAGGQYTYLREAFSPLWGFLYGWTLFMVIQTGTIAAVGIGFARYLGVLWPAISESNYIIPPIDLGSSYALSLNTAQFTAILVFVILTWTNLMGLKYGKAVMNVFTVAKLGALAAVILLGLFVGAKSEVIQANFTNSFTPRNFVNIAPGLSPETLFGLLVALAVAQVGSLFSADAWNNITFTAGEVRNPKRNVPLSLALGTGIVIALYFLANVAYLFVLPFSQIQHAASDRVGTAMVESIFPSIGTSLMAVAIMVSSFGCINGLVLSGARAYFAMSVDKVFFRGASEINGRGVPGKSLVMQLGWTIFLVLVRTHDTTNGTYGNLYSNLLDYVISAALIFYILTIAAVFVLRRKQPNTERPYKAFGYPIVPALYIAGAAFILVILFLESF
jgi:APA family basic amino acid/polyamine antiporter